jgi:hypothetical protein
LKKLKIESARSIYHNGYLAYRNDDIDYSQVKIKVNNVVERDYYDAPSFSL